MLLIFYYNFLNRNIDKWHQSNNEVSVPAWRLWKYRCRVLTSLIQQIAKFVQKFKVQLAPLVKELEADKSASFHFIQGPYEVAPPLGYEDFFGGPPYYRFIVPSEVNEDTTDVIERIRDFPQLETPEMTMRELMTYGVAKTDDSARRTLEYLYEIMEKEGPFDGIMGYSEGATIAGTLLLHEQMREELEGRIPMFKCALFFGGWPPMTPTLDGLVLSDESDLMINVPTTHISKFCPICMGTSPNKHSRFLRPILTWKHCFVQCL